MEYDVSTSRSQKQAGVATFMPDKVYSMPKLVRREKEGNSTLEKGTIHSKEIMVFNIH
jgi:hypothetical protein